MSLGDTIATAITGSQDTATEFRRWCKAMLTVSIILTVITAVGTFINMKHSKKS